jgi:hypothetical protein
MTAGREDPSLEEVYAGVEVCSAKIGSVDSISLLVKAAYRRDEVRIWQLLPRPSPALIGASSKVHNPP